MYKHALVIGKFYPPHKGHMLLIETALHESERVTVVVYANDTQTISGWTRADIIRGAFRQPLTKLKVLVLRNVMFEDYDDALVWKAQDHLLDALLREAGVVPDAVFSSENYGAQLAANYGAASVVVDIDRVAVPISGTAVRENLWDKWGSLPRSTRLALIPRVIVVGAESSGTTTLARDIAEWYNGRYVAEYGREYTIDILNHTPTHAMADIKWSKSDFRFIGIRQRWDEDDAAAADDGFPLVVGDTDALATAVWQARYLGGTALFAAQTSDYAGVQKRDLYLITDHEGVEFEDDGLRDGEHLRPQMTRDFEDVLTYQGQPWVLVSGSPEERLAIARKLIDPILSRRSTFEN